MEVSAHYTLTPPTGPAVEFNNAGLKDGVDMLYLTNITGLDSADIRNPQFLKPVADGGYKPVDWKEAPLHPVFEGIFWTGSVPLGADCRAERNALYHALKTCLRNCRGATGTLTWSEVGIDDFELAVSYEVKLTHAFDADYALMTFTFGLFSEASQPVPA